MIILLGSIVLALQYKPIRSFVRMSLILGRPGAVLVIRWPDKVELFPTLYNYWMKTNGSGSLPANLMDKVGPGTNLSPATVRAITQILLSPDSYFPKTNYVRGGVFAPEVVLRFNKGQNVVEIVFSPGSASALFEPGPGEKVLDLLPVSEQLARIIGPYLSRLITTDGTFQSGYGVRP